MIKCDFCGYRVTRTPHGLAHDVFWTPYLKPTAWRIAGLGYRCPFENPHTSGKHFVASEHVRPAERYKVFEVRLAMVVDTEFSDPEPDGWDWDRVLEGEPVEAVQCFLAVPDGAMPAPPRDAKIRLDTLTGMADIATNLNIHSYEWDDAQRD